MYRGAMARNLAQKLIGDRLVAGGPTPGAEVGIRIDQIADRARATGDHFVVGGWNCGQSSSREHAAIVPRYLRLRAVLARSLARIHRQNLMNFAVLPLTFADAADNNGVEPGETLVIAEAPSQMRDSMTVDIANETRGGSYVMHHCLTERQVNIILQGSLLDAIRNRQPTAR